jgi:hypothetical protein
VVYNKDANFMKLSLFTTSIFSLPLGHHLFLAPLKLKNLYTLLIKPVKGVFILGVLLLVWQGGEFAVVLGGFSF